VLAGILETDLGFQLLARDDFGALQIHNFDEDVARLAIFGPNDAFSGAAIGNLGAACGRDLPTDELGGVRNERRDGEIDRAGVLSGGSAESDKDKKRNDAGHSHGGIVSRLDTLQQARAKQHGDGRPSIRAIWRTHPGTRLARDRSGRSGLNEEPGIQKSQPTAESAGASENARELFHESAGSRYRSQEGVAL
jgi:hypothetical protein